MRISCIQSIFFGVRDASLVRDEAGFNVLSTHLDTVCRWANALAAEGLVFGAPAMRSGCTEAIQTIERRLLTLHEQVESHGQRLLLEAASPRFGTDFGASTTALLDLMTRFPQLHLHLDVGQMMEEGLNLEAVISAWLPRVAHIHLSAPDLAMPIPETIAVWKDVIMMMEVSQAAAVVEIQHIDLEESLALVDLMTELRAICPK
jgi:sugar phosphate isomerase/epimerase